MIEQRLNRILVIDDDEGIRTVLEIAMGDLGGYTLLLCDSGAEAIAQAASFQPDLIIVDSMMPGMDGVETLTRLRHVSGLAQTPAVGITAGYVDAALAALPHVIGMLRKPFYPQTIAREIEALWSASPSISSVAISPHQLDLVRQRYRDDLTANCTELQRLLNETTPATLDQARALLHQLIGTGTTLGFQRVGAAARNLAQHIQNYQASSVRLSEESTETRRLGLPAAMDGFLAAVQQARDDQASWADASPTATVHQEQR